jgi:uncharacterized damage-inducible protein DinB
MSMAGQSLQSVYEGWDGHQLALVRAISALTSAQLAYRPAPHLRSVGELVSHIALGRIDWFHRMGAPGSAELARQIASEEPEKADTEHPAALGRWLDAIARQEAAITAELPALLHWLEASWRMIETTLTTWSVTDLAETYRHAYAGKTFAVSRQWTIWRILAHDLHHGGQVATLLGLQGIEIPDLGDQGGHLTELPLAAP